MRDAAAGREARLTEAFVTLADGLVSDFDVTGLFETLADTCVDLFRLAAAGILLTELNGRLAPAALVSGTATGLLELEIVQAPFLECLATGARIAVREPAAPGTSIWRKPWPM